jgi:energy-coupling factor transporter ATP-binding protein EcfA2
VNAIVPPLALDGPVLSIRRFSATPLTMANLVEYKTLVPQMAELLTGLSKAKLNLLISGGTGSGKTTLLNILSGYIPQHERIVTIEDAAELRLQQPHVVRLETRPPNIEGRGEVTQRALVRNALRMRPDRIILGEVRDAEALDMLQAMNTGHEGSMGTIHANTPREALTRLENMLGMAGMSATPKVMRTQIASAINVVVQVSRLADGKRKIVSLSEITGMEGEVITMQEIFLPADQHRRRRHGPRPLRSDRCGPNSRIGCERLDPKIRRAVRAELALRVAFSDLRCSPIPGSGLSRVCGGACLSPLCSVSGRPLPVVELERGPEARRMERRLRAMSAGGHGEEQLSLLKRRTLAESPAYAQLLMMVPRVASIDRMLMQSGLTLSVGDLVGATLGLGAAGLFAPMLFSRPLWWGIPLALALGALPLLYVLALGTNAWPRSRDSCPTPSI